jgi:tetratricopeptide (TPR) repeat protein
MPDYSYFELEEKLIYVDGLLNDNALVEAVKILEQILLDAPDFGKAHNYLGWIYDAKIRDYGKATHHYEMAIRFAPDYAATYYNYAVVLSNLNRFKELEDLLYKALLVPGINLGTIHHDFGTLRESEQKYKLAIDNYKLAIKHSFNDDMIESAEKSILRCERKLKLR